jgi:hypothetical protein
MDNVIRGAFNRLEGWSEVGSIRATATKSGSETVWELCRQLLDAGHPDAALRMYDERGMHCYTIGSFHKAARRALRVSDTIPTATYIGLRYVLIEAWPAVHQKTKEALQNREYVEIEGDFAILTDAGITAMNAYETVHGAPEVLPPAAVRDKATAVVKEPRQKRVYLTKRQVEGFTIATKQPYKWEIVVPTKTRKLMVDAGWVIIIKGDPTLTDEGQRVWNAHLVNPAPAIEVQAA